MLRVLRDRWRVGSGPCAVCGAGRLRRAFHRAARSVAQGCRDRLHEIRRGEGDRHHRAGRADQRSRHVRRGFPAQGRSPRRQRDARLFRRIAAAGKCAECRSATLAGAERSGSCRRRRPPATIRAMRRSHRRSPCRTSGNSPIRCGQIQSATRRCSASRSSPLTEAAMSGRRCRSCRRAAAVTDNGSTPATILLRSTQ